MDKHPHGRFLVEKRVRRCLLFSRLKGSQHRFPGRIVHHDCAGFRLPKSACVNLFLVDQGQNQPIRNEWPEFLHQVQSQAGAAGAIAVKASDRGVQSNRLKRRSGIMRQKRVNKRQERIDLVEGWTAVPSLEAAARHMTDFVPKSRQPTARASGWRRARNFGNPGLEL